MWKRLLLTIGLVAGFTAISVGTQPAVTAEALGNCSAWYITAIPGGGWRGGRSRCTSACGPCGAGIQRVIVRCSNGGFVKGPYVGVNQLSSANCAVGLHATGVWEEAP